jgi:hypothetical protein
MDFVKPIIDLPPAHPDMPDPVCREDDLWQGIDWATEYLGLSLEDVVRVFWHSRPAAIMGFAGFGAELVASDPSAAHVNSLVGCLRGLLRETGRGSRF